MRVGPTPETASLWAGTSLRRGRCRGCWPGGGVGDDSRSTSRRSRHQGRRMTSIPSPHAFRPGRGTLSDGGYPPQGCRGLHVHTPFATLGWRLCRCCAPAAAAAACGAALCCRWCCDLLTVGLFLEYDTGWFKLKARTLSSGECPRRFFRFRP